MKLDFFIINISCLEFNMKISIHKMKAIPIGKDPISCRLEIDDRVVNKLWFHVQTGKLLCPDSYVLHAGYFPQSYFIRLRQTAGQNDK